ncbi:hypothetical protein FRB99_001371 [Tulasnella sp. 403]|nr:hypothetical protein FRB99_001371 [Tulasnella sp. 403]
MAAPLYHAPLHLFSIPLAVLDDLVIRPSPLSPPQESATQTNEPVPDLGVGPSSSLTATTCTLCVGATFSNVDEQRAHFRSDWHRYNVKLKLQNTSAQPVTEGQFANLVDGLDESISGSESGSSDGSEGSADAVSTLLQKTRLRNQSRSPSPTAGIRMPRSPIIWFSSPKVPDTQFGVYTTVFPSYSDQTQYVDELRYMQDERPNGRQWAVFMTAGGHFAGAIIRVARPAEEPEATAPGGSKKKSKANRKADIEIIRHKTFHRYTTRRKQGGSQSVNDNAKGPAKSAGALLRRYGEQALKDDIRELLVEWRDDIDTSEMTQSEVIRCTTEMTRVKISHLTEEALAAQDQALLDSLPKPKPIAPAIPAPAEVKPVVQKLSPEEARKRELVNQLIDLTRKGKLGPLKTFWERHGRDLLGSVDGRLPDWLQGKDSGGGGTLLHIAAAANQPEIVRWLLEDLRSDPTIPLPPSFTRYRESEEPADSDDGHQTGRATAYNATTSTETRNVFRRCAYKYPDWWDWLGAGRVRSLLTPEMEAQQQREENNRRSKMREKAKAREAARLAEMPEEVAPSPPQPKPKAASTTGPQRVGGGGSVEKERQAIVGLTPEMRAKIERERRARAAEARLRGLGN